jgi:hypothetical protein
VAVMFPDFGFLTSFTGCLSNALLAFVLPPWFYLALFWKDHQSGSLGDRLVIVLNAALASVGFVFAIASTSQLLQQS